MQRPDPSTIVAAASAAAVAAAQKRGVPGEWDIANMAPKQKKGMAGEEKGAVGVISAAAKRNRQEEGFVVTAAQVALMGGQWKPSADEECVRPQMKSISLRNLSIQDRNGQTEKLLGAEIFTCDLAACFMKALGPGRVCREFNGVSKCRHARM